MRGLVLSGLGLGAAGWMGAATTEGSKRAEDSTQGAICMLQDGKACNPPCAPGEECCDPGLVDPFCTLPGFTCCSDTMCRPTDTCCLNGDGTGYCSQTGVCCEPECPP